MIYDRPVTELMADAANRSFTVQDVAAWVGLIGVGNPKKSGSAPDVNTIVEPTQLDFRRT